MADNRKNMTQSGEPPVSSQQGDPHHPHYDADDLADNERRAPPSREPTGPQETGAGEINRPGGTQPASPDDPRPSDDTQSAPPGRSLV